MSNTQAEKLCTCGALLPNRRFTYCEDCKKALCRRKASAWKKQNRARVRSYQREYYHRHGEHHRAKSRERYLGRRDAHRAYQLEAKYGITVEGYEALLEEQGHVCGICQKNPGGNLVVDHNHVTGRVRGLLCSRCNLAMGQFEDDPELLNAAAVWAEVS